MRYHFNSSFFRILICKLYSLSHSLLFILHIGRAGEVAKVPLPSRPSVDVESERATYHWRTSMPTDIIPLFLLLICYLCSCCVKRVVDLSWTEWRGWEWGHPIEGPAWSSPTLRLNHRPPGSLFSHLIIRICFIYYYACFNCAVSLTRKPPETIFPSFPSPLRRLTYARARLCPLWPKSDMNGTGRFWRKNGARICAAYGGSG